MADTHETICEYCEVCLSIKCACGYDGDDLFVDDERREAVCPQCGRRYRLNITLEVEEGGAGA